MSYHHVMRQKIIILYLQKSKYFQLTNFNLFKVYYYNFKNNNISIQKNPLVIILNIIMKP